MSERTMMLGRLEEAKIRRREMTLKAEGLCTSIRQDISPVLYDIEEMKIPVSAQMMDELVMVYAELLGLRGKIERLSRELGNGQ